MKLKLINYSYDGLIMESQKNEKLLLTECESTALSRLSTAMFRAPEGILHDFGEKQDVFAFGMVAYMILTALEPFGSSKGGLSSFDVIHAIKVGQRPDFPVYDNDSIEDFIKAIIEDAWADSADARSDIAEIKERCKLIMGEFDINMSEL